MNNQEINQENNEVNQNNGQTTDQIINNNKQQGIVETQSNITVKETKKEESRKRHSKSAKKKHKSKHSKRSTSNTKKSKKHHSNKKERAKSSRSASKRVKKHQKKHQSSRKNHKRSPTPNKRDRSRHRRSKHYSSSSSSRSSSKKSSSGSSSRSRSSDRRRRNNNNYQRNHRRTRSRSLLAYYRQNMNNINGKQNTHIDSNNMQIDTEKFYWDGFLWQPKINMQIMDENFLKQTEKQRKIQIDNIPFEYGLDKIDIISYVTNYMKEKSLANNDNINPVLNCDINEEDKTATLELSSVPETNLMYKLGKVMFFQNECKISRIGETLDGLNNLKQLTQLARQQAEAQAAVIKATENIISMKFSEKLTVNKLDKKPRYKVLKVLNIIVPGTENILTVAQWDDLHADLVEEFQRYGNIVHSFIVRPYQATVGAKCGTLFVEYDNAENAFQALEYNNGRVFNGQQLKIFNIPEEGYNLNFKQLVYIKN